MPLKTLLRMEGWTDEELDQMEEDAQDNSAEGQLARTEATKQIGAANLEGTVESVTEQIGEGAREAVARGGVVEAAARGGGEKR